MGSQYKDCLLDIVVQAPHITLRGMGLYGCIKTSMSVGWRFFSVGGLPHIFLVLVLCGNLLLWIWFKVYLELGW